MLLDLISTDNYVSFNKKLAHVIGLNESIYVNQLVNIMGKATKKDKLSIDGYVTLDREYIYSQTTLDLNTQLAIDKKLESINLLLRDIIDPDLVKIDTQLLASIINEDDVKTLSDISKATKKDKKVDKETKNHYIIQKLCESLHTQNQELDIALKGWLEGCFAKGGYLNAQLVEKFQKDLYNYSKGKLSVAKEIIELATLYGYRECAWAIKIYEQNQINRKNGEVKEAATVETLSSKSF